MRQTIRRLETTIRCWFGAHELVRDLVDADPKTEAPAKIRLKCLNCRKVTPGWDQGARGYHLTYDRSGQAAVVAVAGAPDSMAGAVVDRAGAR